VPADIFQLPVSLPSGKMLISSLLFGKCQKKKKGLAKLCVSFSSMMNIIFLSQGG
jgi:hypothetical protein